MINMRQLEAFHAVMEAGSVSRAAEMLHVSQPAVTKLLQAFEADLGLALFTRSRNRLAPTAEAFRLHEEIDRLFLHIGRIRHMANEIRSFGSGQLNIGAMPALGLHFLPDMLSAFKRQHSGVDIVLSVASSQKVVEMVLAQQIDLGFFASPLSALTPSASLFARLPGVVVLPKDNPLTRLAALTPSDLEGVDFVSLGREDKTRLLADALFGAHKVARHVSIETQIAACACQFVANGHGVSIVDPITAYYHRDQVAVRPMTPTIHFEIAMARPISRPESTILSSFIAFIEARVASFANGIADSPVPDDDTLAERRPPAIRTRPAARATRRPDGPRRNA
jgi:DNA-binding transcriptional LysR family regulator